LEGIKAMVKLMWMEWSVDGGGIVPTEYEINYYSCPLENQ
jgi:archaellum component FlaD/FlaE